MKKILRILIVPLVVTTLLAGCGGAGRRDIREEQDPLFKRARARKQAQDIEGAIELYNKAIGRKPGLARAHLELGLLYDGYREDYVRALYHYERYLELRPDTEKKELIEDLVRRARISFAATLPDTPSGAIEEIAELKRENDALKHKLAQMDEQAPPVHVAAVPRPAPRHSAPQQSPVSRPPVAPPPAMTAPSPAPAQPAMQSYRVQRGDTLSSIAAKMYNDPNQWKKIFEANQGTMKSPGSLRVGQTLVIPPR